MSLFHKNKRKAALFPFDRTLHRPVIYSSICTGEKRAGFEWIETGRFEEIMCLRTPGDLAAFMEDYGLTESEIETKY